MPNAATSKTAITTLSHLYDNRPVQHRRDFVRENKENVRDKHQQHKHEKSHQIDGYMPFSSSADQISSRSSGYANVRTRKPPTAAIMPANYTSTTAGTAAATAKKPRSPTRKEPWTYGREASDRKTNLAQKASKTNAMPPKAGGAAAANRRISSTKVQKAINLNKTKVPTSSKAVQTEEINDEIYLYNALKKCASPAFKTALKAKYLQKEKESKHNSSSKETGANGSQELALPLDDSQELPAHEQHDERQHVEQANFKREHIRQKAGEAKIAEQQRPQAFSRAESAQTDFTHDSQRSFENYRTARGVVEYRPPSNLNVMTMPTGSLSHCTPSKCANNCPEGYHLLSEEERDAIRTKLLEHEALLIKQLNSFPLAIETLRVRQSKTRIEKELTILEHNLRKLTKRKVYAKIPE